MWYYLVKVVTSRRADVFGGAGFDGVAEEQDRIIHKGAHINKLQLPIWNADDTNHDIISLLK